MQLENHLGMASLGAHEPPSLAGTLAFQHVWHTYVWPAESPGWSPGSLSQCPLCPRKKGRSRGNARSGGKLQSPERVDSGIFQGWERTLGARELSHLRGLGVLSLSASFLARGLSVCLCCVTHRERGEGSREPGNSSLGMRSRTIPQQPATCLRGCSQQRHFLPKPQG